MLLEPKRLDGEVPAIVVFAQGGVGAGKVAHEARDRTRSMLAAIVPLFSLGPRVLPARSVPLLSPFTSFLKFSCEIGTPQNVGYIQNSKRREEEEGGGGGRRELCGSERGIGGGVDFNWDPGGSVDFIWDPGAWTLP